MIYKIVGKGKDYKELEIGENNEEIGLTIINNDTDSREYIQIPRGDWEEVILSMEQMKSIRDTENKE